MGCGRVVRGGVMGSLGGRIYLVDVAEGGFFDGFVLDDFSEDTAVTAADDEHFLGVGVGVHG